LGIRHVAYLPAEPPLGVAELEQEEAVVTLVVKQPPPEVATR
jgi:hypothetical protein